MKNGRDMNGLNGIKVDGKVYEVAEYGRRECNECELKKKCMERSIDENPYCASFSGRRRKILRFSQTLTDKINN